MLNQIENKVVYSKRASQLRDLFINELDFYYSVSNVDFSVNSDWRISITPGVRDLDKINEKLKRLPNWKKKRK